MPARMMSIVPPSSAGISESNAISVISSSMPSLSAIAAAMSASMPATSLFSSRNSYGGNCAFVPMTSVPPSVFSAVSDCWVSSALVSSVVWVLPPPQPVSSIEPASTMLSMAIESFFIMISLLPKCRFFRPCKHVNYYTVVCLKMQPYFSQKSEVFSPSFVRPAERVTPQLRAA